MEKEPSNGSPLRVILIILFIVLVQLLFVAMLALLISYLIFHDYWSLDK
jgi:hypothetical protein